MRNLFIAFVLLCGCALAQNLRYDNIALGPKGPIAFATVAVCTQPATTSTQPCSPLANLCSSFTDTACTQPNPLTADFLGNYHFYLKTAQSAATVQIYGPTVAAPFVMVDQSPGTAVNGSGTFTNTQMNNYLVSMVGGLTPIEYNTVQTGNFATDAISGGVAVPSGSTVHQADGVAGYVTVNGSATAGVGLYSQCRLLTNTAFCFGINPLMQDAVGLTGTKMINEFDLNISGTPNRVNALLITGAPITGTLPSGPPTGFNSALTSRADLIEFIFNPAGNSFPAGIVSARGAINGPILQGDSTCFTGACASQTIVLCGNSNPTPNCTTLGSDQNGSFSITVPASQSVKGNNIPIVTALTTTAATSDNVTVTGMTASGHCALQATNASAATNTATTYVSNKTTNQITVTHTATSGMTYDVLCTQN